MSATTDQRERELKFDVPDDWEIAEPAALVPSGGSIEREQVQLESVYFDTERLDLLRSGLTLRPTAAMRRGRRCGNPLPSFRLT